MAIELNEKELQNIKALEDDLIKAQQIELRLKSEQGKIQKTIDGAVRSAAFYTSIRAQEQLLKELKQLLEKIIEAGAKRGKLMGRKTLQRFLEDHEKRQLTARQLRLIDQMNVRQAERRLKVAFAELEKEFNVLKADIDIFKQNVRLSGFTAKDTLKQLVRASKDKAGVAQGFAKRMKSVAVAAERREASAREIAEYRKQAKRGERWTWITVSANPCPDCEARAGVSLPLERWMQLGVPGSGRTICGKFCRCIFRPDSVADDQFPQVRVFAWNKKDTVLTTASEARVLKAKGNRNKSMKRVLEDAAKKG